MLHTLCALLLALTTQDKPALEVTVRVESREVVATEPVKLSVQVRNTTNLVLSGPPPGIDFWRGMRPLVSTDGQTYEPLPSPGGLTAPHKYEFVQYAPNESLRFYGILSGTRNKPAFGKAGKYHLRVSVISDGDEPLLSAPVELTVLELPDSDKAAAQFLEEKGLFSHLSPESMRLAYDRTTLENLDSFVRQFSTSRYEPYARLGLGAYLYKHASKQSNGTEAGAQAVEGQALVILSDLTARPSLVRTEAFYLVGDIAYEHKDFATALKCFSLVVASGDCKSLWLRAAREKIESMKNQDGR